ncbi:MAG: GNAT family N-acetyltransferase [Clostridia bacterium]|nr:GNAT family N-acetyltransferase [Clostridia bacterium]
MVNFRKATAGDLDVIAQIYSLTHDEIEAGRAQTGWVRSIYPTRESAAASLERGDMFVCELDGHLCASAIINQIQVDVYDGAPWEYPADDNKVMVLHTLVVSPEFASRGLGTAFVEFYERYALKCGCPNLRMDTNALNLRARALYKRLGYKEIAILPCRFNGIDGVDLVLLEKYIG